MRCLEVIKCFEKHRKTLLFSSSLSILQRLGLFQCIIEIFGHLKYRIVAQNISGKAFVDVFPPWKSKHLWPAVLFLMARFDHVMTLLRSCQSLLAS